mmetsp:Transcript_39092/g.38718  ORF Transcript_39092/g.38718 Transcript_39092/m.38718 type:complete len:179 (-) Transcript_39092:15-551(-)
MARKEEGLSGFNNTSLNSSETGMMQMPTFGFTNTFSSNYNRIGHSSQTMRESIPESRSQTNQLFMSEMMKPQPSFGRDRDQGFQLFESRTINDNFHYHSDISEEDAKGMDNKIEEPSFVPFFPRQTEVTPSRFSSFNFQTSTEMGGGMNRLNMGPPRGHDSMMENQYPKIDFSHNNKF